MGRIYVIIAIIMLFPMQSQAYADTPVRARSDGKLVDINGDITAIPNPSDPRNTKYEKYYTNVSGIIPGVQDSGKSDFYVILDPDAGYIRKEIELENGNQVADMGNSTEVAQNIEPGIVNGKTGLILEYIPEMPIYDRYNTNQFSVYGD